MNTTQPRRITTTNATGEPIDITEGVQVLYDLVTSSMDWGSGFWTEDDIQPVRALVEAVGFPGLDNVDAYLEDLAKSAERQRADQARHQALAQERDQQQRDYDHRLAAREAGLRFAGHYLLTSKTGDAPTWQENIDRDGWRFTITTNTPITPAIEEALWKQHQTQQKKKT